MAGFEFHNTQMAVTICGKEYRFETDSQKQARLAAIGRQFQEAGEAEPEEARIARLTQAVEVVLGEGAVAVIFGERIVNSADLTDLVFYLAEAVTKEQERRAKAVMNRAQRRAARLGKA